MYSFLYNYWTVDFYLNLISFHVLVILKFRNRTKVIPSDIKLDILKLN